MKTSRPQPLHWLTVLRYPAALWVLLFHCLQKTDLVQTIGHRSLGCTLLERGFLGVSFFFMLSGFILAWNYPVIRSVSDYATARAARILPVYYLSLLFAVPLVINEVATEGFYKAFLLKMLMVLTLIQSWVPTVPHIWNPPGWTLSCEAFFYTSLVFALPLLTRGFAGRPISNAVSSLTAIWILGLILPAAFCLHYGADFNPSDAAHMTKTEGFVEAFIERFPAMRVLDFLAGVILCVSTRQLIPALSAARAAILAVAGLAWLSTSLFLPFMLSIGTWCLPGFACLLVGAAALPSPRHNGLFNFGILLGQASYAVYLFHFSLRDYLLMFYRRLLGAGALSPLELMLALSAATTLLTTALSILIFYWYEEPMRVLVKSVVSKRLLVGPKENAEPVI